MSPHNQKKLIFNNSCECLFEPEVLEKAMLWWANGKVLMQNRKVYMHGNYPAVSIFDEKLHIHRLIYCYNNRKKLLRSMHVHHLDDNKLNSLVNNLEEIGASAHMSHHNKGKTLSKEHKIKIGIAGRKRKGMKMKKRLALVGLTSLVDSGMSINAIAKHYNCDWSTIKRRLLEQP